MCVGVRVCSRVLDISNGHLELIFIEFLFRLKFMNRNEKPLNALI